MLTYDEALALVLGQARPLDGEAVPLDLALGRRLTAPVVAAVDAPPADVSAMDGYAVREADLGLGSLRVVGQSFPGAPFRGAVPEGCCVRIFTGGALPPVCDRIVIQEIVERSGDEVRIVGDVGAARFVRKRGMDFAAGETLVPAGRVVDARVLVAAAGADIGELTVHRQPFVTIFATGDELAEAGKARATADAIPDSASHGVAGLVRGHGGGAVRVRLPDDLDTIAKAAESLATRTDVLVVIGGASVGEKDFAKAALDQLGMQLIFSKAAIRPGKPIWFGRLGDMLVLGLPGNPTSAMAMARLFLCPLLAGLRGEDSGTHWREASLAGSLPACDARETFVRARLAVEGVLPLGNQDSSAQKTLADADVLIRRKPGAAAAAAGELVEVIDF